MTTDAVRGLWCATLTPLAKDGTIDHARFAALAHWLFARGVDGIAPFGTTGEGQSFSVAERQGALDQLLAAGIAPSRIVAGTGCAALPDAVALTRHALRAGVSRCLLLPPFFFKGLPDEAIFAFHAALIEAVGDTRLRLYLYHLPQVSAVPLSADLVGRLADAFPEVIAGVKDSEGDWSHTQALLERVPGLAVLVGHEPHLPRLMRAGGAGTICGVANVLPQLVRALVGPDVAPEDERRIAAFLAILFRFPLLPAFKAMRAAQTNDPGWLRVRPPLVPLADSAQADWLAALLAGSFVAHEHPQ